MSQFKMRGVGLRSLVAGAAMAIGVSAADATTITIDFGTGGLASVPSPYLEDGFEVAGTDLLLTEEGNPPRDILLDSVTLNLIVTMTGGGLFSLMSFDYSCTPCDFDVQGLFGSGGAVSPLSVFGSTGVDEFETLSPPGFTNLSSLSFLNFSGDRHRLDNIVLEFTSPLSLPLPASLALLISGLLGLGAVRHLWRAERIVGVG
jgi:hypothetical protein